MASTPISPILLSHLQRGMQHLQTGRAERAIAEFRIALNIDQDNVQANYACALASFQLDQLAEAEQFLRRVIRLQPNFFPAFNTLGVVLRAAGRDAEGIASLERALVINGNYAEAAFNLALAFADLKETLKQQLLGLHEAIAAGERATKLEPGSFETWEALGHAQLLAGDSGRGAASLARANDLHPNVPQLQYDLGVAQIANGDLASGRKTLDAVEAQRPDWIKILFERDLALPPLYESQHHIAESRAAWITGLEKIETRLFDSQNWSVEEAMKALLAHSAFYLNYQDTDNTALQQRFARVVEYVVQRAYPQFTKPLTGKSSTDGERLRIGFTSAHLRKHSVGYFFGAWITELDQTKFESFVWHTGEISDAITDKIRAKSSRFSSAPHDMARFAETILAAKLDVLIHLDVGMHPHAQVLAAMRLASVQCVAYGHPVTTGLSTIDYYLSADAAEPDNAQAAYSETLIRLPKLGVCYPLPDIANRTLPGMLFKGKKTRQKPFLLCVQRLFKVLPHMDSLIARIAKQLPGCGIAFFASPSPSLNETFVQRVTTAMKCHGVDAATTLQMLPAMTYENFLGTVEAADMVLDTTHFSGGNSSFDAFAVGAPIVAYEGAMMRGRQTSAMLRIMNIPELITDSDDAYVATVVALAKDPQRLRAIRTRILAGRDALFNDVSAVRALEETLARIASHGR